MNKFILIMFLLIPSIVFPKKNTIKSEGGTQAKKCKIGLYVKTLELDEINKNFSVFFYWWLRIDSIEDDDFDYSRLADFEVVNGQSEINILNTVKNDDKSYYYVYGSCRSVIPFRCDFHRFPYDKQNLKISIEHLYHNIEEIIFIQDNNNINENNDYSNKIELVNNDEFEVMDINSFNDVYEYSTNFGDPEVSDFDKYSRMNFVINVQRVSDSIIKKLFIPLSIVLILSYLVFYIPDDAIETASALTVTSLLAAIAFQWTINDSLPKVSYYTLVDRIFHLVYVYIFYAMVQTVLTFNLSLGSDMQKRLSYKIEIHSRWAFPVSFILFIYYLYHSYIF